MPANLWDGSGPCILKKKTGVGGNVPDFNVLDWPERLHDMLSGNAHRAEA